MKTERAFSGGRKVSKHENVYNTRPLIKSRSKNGHAFTTYSLESHGFKMKVSFGGFIPITGLY
jgi:hypothetical protein